MTCGTGCGRRADDDRVALYRRLPVTRDADWWAGLAARSGGAVLYLGCGTGRLLPALARSSRLVVAVDADPRMLDVAADHIAGRAGVRAHVHLVAGRAEAVPVTGRFGLVLLPSNLLNELPDRAARAATLRACALRCRAGGRVALQILNPYFLARARRWEGLIEPAGGGAPIKVSGGAAHYDPWTQRYHAPVSYRFADGAELEHTMDAAAVFPEELVGLACRAGLAVQERWGARPGKDPLDGDAPTWHLVCAPRQRPAGRMRA